MAYDTMGNYIGDYADPALETEEERRRRLEQEALAAKTGVAPVANAPAPVKQTITTDPRTGEQTMKIEGRVQDLSAANPLTPTVTGPVSPDMGAIRQVESGNRDFTPAGQPVTSPRGAMFASQVMPATATNPGFGVRPAQAQTPEEYNRVGQDYYNAMLQRYGGDREKALAAYNAGPGRVDRNMQANAGQMNMGQMPRETQGYVPRVLDKILGGLVPSAAAAELPPTAAPQPGRAPVPTMRPGGAPQPAPVQAPVNPAQPAPVQAQPAPAAQPMVAGPRTQPANDFVSLYQANENDPLQLLTLARDDRFTPEQKQQFNAAAQDLMVKERQRTRTEQEVKDIYQKATETGNFSPIAKMIKSTGEEGSWAKMILLGFLSPELAGKEAAKLGLKDQTVTSMIGNEPVILKMRDGVPISGFSGTTAKELTAEQLVAAAASVTGQKNLDIVGGSYVSDTLKDKNGQPLVGRMVSNKNTGQTFIQTDDGLKPMAGFRPQSSTGSLADMRARTIQEINLKLQGKTEEEKMAILRPYNQILIGAGQPAIDPSEVGIKAPQIAGGVPGTSTVTPPGLPIPSATREPVPGGAIAPTPVQPGAVSTGGTVPTGAVAPTAVQPGTMPAGTRPTQAQLEADAAKLKEEAEVVGKDIGTIRANFGKSKDAATTLVNQAQDLITDPGFEVSVGFSAQPGFQYIPGSDRATWKAKHDEVVGKTFLTAIENLKGMGALSDREGEAATNAISRLKNTDQNEESFKAAVKELQDIVKRGVDRNAEKLGKPSVFGTKAVEEKTAEGEVDQNNPLLKKKKK